MLRPHLPISNQCLHTTSTSSFSSPSSLPPSLSIFISTVALARACCIPQGAMVTHIHCPGASGTSCCPGSHPHVLVGTASSACVPLAAELHPLLSVSLGARSAPSYHNRLFTAYIPSHSWPLLVVLLSAAGPQSGHFFCAAERPPALLDAAPCGFWPS